MNLRKEQFPHLIALIVKELKDKELAQVKVSEEKILSTLQAVLEKNHREELKLNQEAENILDQYSAQISQGGLNASELFLKIKKELAKKKGFIL